MVSTLVNIHKSFGFIKGHFDDCVIKLCASASDIFNSVSLCNEQH